LGARLSRSGKFSEQRAGEQPARGPLRHPRICASLS
jgi:hypothetical protein